MRLEEVRFGDLGCGRGGREGERTDQRNGGKRKNESG